MYVYLWKNAQTFTYFTIYNVRLLQFSWQENDYTDDCFMLTNITINQQCVTSTKMQCPL